MTRLAFMMWYISNGPDENGNDDDDDDYIGHESGDDDYYSDFVASVDVEGCDELVVMMVRFNLKLF